MIVAMGDFNAKIGQDWRIWKGPIGKFGYGEENTRRERLLQFCFSNNFKIMNTVFQQRKNSRKWTWEPPDRKVKNMIDFILVSNRWASKVTMCRSFQRPDVGSDHQLVKAGIRIKFKRMYQQTSSQRFDADRLKDDMIVEEYCRFIHDRSKTIKRILWGLCEGN
jgi:hypothetical protein